MAVGKRVAGAKRAKARSPTAKMAEGSQTRAGPTKNPTGKETGSWKNKPEVVGKERPGWP